MEISNWFMMMTTISSICGWLVVLYLFIKVHIMAKEINEWRFDVWQKLNMNVKKELKH